MPAPRARSGRSREPPWPARRCRCRPGPAAAWRCWPARPGRPGAGPTVSAIANGRSSRRSVKCGSPARAQAWSTFGVVGGGRQRRHLGQQLGRGRDVGQHAGRGPGTAAQGAPPGRGQADPGPGTGGSRGHRIPRASLNGTAAASASPPGPAVPAGPPGRCAAVAVRGLRPQGGGDAGCGLPAAAGAARRAGRCRRPGRPRGARPRPSSTRARRRRCPRRRRPGPASSSRYSGHRAVSSSWVPCVDQPALVQHRDPVGQLQRGPAVRDQQRGPPGHDLAQRGVDLGLDPGVDGRGRVVQHQDRGVGDQRPGQRDPLALPAGQGEALLADDGVVAVRQVADELVGLGGPGRRDDLLLGRGRAGRRRCSRARVSENRKLSSITSPIEARSESRVRSRTSYPPTRTAPPRTS